MERSSRRGDGFLRQDIFMKGLDVMLILSRVCADFRNQKGEVVHRVTPANRLTFHEAPESIREDPLFRLLVGEGSLEAAVTPVEKKQLEAEPLKGVDAACRKRTASKKTAEDPPVCNPQNN